MAVIHAVLKQNSAIRKISNAELCHLLLKSLSTDCSVYCYQRGLFYYKVVKLGQLDSFTSIRNRCLFTGRARAVIKNVHIGRHIYKKLSSGASMAGVGKATW